MARETTLNSFASLRSPKDEKILLPPALAAVLMIYLPDLGNALAFDDGYLADGEVFYDYARALQFRARRPPCGSFAKTMP